MLIAPCIAPPPAGNVGGEEELAAVRQAAADIQAAAEGFADFLAAVAQRAGEGGEGGEGQRLGDALLAAVREMEQMDWMVPPMLQPR